MAQQAIPNGPTHSDVRTVLNENVTDTETRLAALEAAGSPAAGMAIVEEFVGAGAATNQYGAHGWAISGGTTVGTVGEASHPGILNRATGTTNNTVASLYLPGVVSPVFLPAETFTVRWVFRPNAITDAIIRIGLASGFAVAAGTSPSSGAYLEKLAADTNWFFVTRVSSTETRTDSGVAATASSWYAVIVRRVDASTIGCRVGTTVAAAEAATEMQHTTNLPTAAQMIGMHVQNTAAATKTVDLDYASLAITGMTR